MPFTSTKIGQPFLEYLREIKPLFIQAWEKSIEIDAGRIDKERVSLNGSTMFEITMQLLGDTLDEKEVKTLAYKVATERSQASINIGDFIYNVYKGRSTILTQINKFNFAVNDFILVNEKINDLFDRFIRYTLTKYMEIKDSELKEKMLFIKETHKDRLTLLGQMSSSFVHEFRNPLTAIMGFVKLMKAGHINELYLDTIQHELEELNFRITQFLHTSRLKLDEQSKKEVAIIGLIEDLIQFLYPSLVSEDIEIVTRFESEPTIVAQEDELKQVILNLLMNSIEAVKSDPNDPYIGIFCKMEANFVKIQITNNGPKIPEEALNVIFEPFFTTKELGTGIGLYVCKKIIELNHGGKIECQSDDELTTFTVYLPTTA
jgi:signal transduction histidine kinase